jgi:ribosomal protein L24E
MKRTGMASALFILSLIFAAAMRAQEEFPRLEGPYLGQKPPGLKPRRFAPGIITTAEHEGSSGFGLNGSVFIFQRFLDSQCHTYIMRLKDGRWTAPELIPFWKTMVHNGDFVISSDDRTMLYQVKTETAAGLVSNIWRVEITDSGWSERTPLPAPVNTSYDESFASEAADKNLYFFSRRPGGKGLSDIYMCSFRDNKYSDPVNLESLNTEYHEWDPFIAADGSYLIFCSTKPGGFGGDDFYISFKSDDGGWTTPLNMGEEINSPGSENRPYVTRDGRYFFFTSTREWNRDIYWVATAYLDRFKK